MNRPPVFRSFAEFYPYYLDQHRSRTSRILHLVGLVLSVTAFLIAVVTGHYVWLLATLGFGYGPGWLGHFVFEGNKPAAFGHPFYSLLGDCRMAFDTLTGRV